MAIAELVGVYDADGGCWARRRTTGASCAARSTAASATSPTRPCAARASGTGWRRACRSLSGSSTSTSSTTTCARLSPRPAHRWCWGATGRTGASWWRSSQGSPTPGTVTNPGWYAGLERPFFQPPDIVFGLMWPLNFLLLLVVGLTSIRTALTVVAWTATGSASVVLALGWAWLFYVPHQPGPAAACLAGAAVLTCILLAVVTRHETWAGLLLSLYALWLSVAKALSVAYARLN